VVPLKDSVEKWLGLGREAWRDPRRRGWLIGGAGAVLAGILILAWPPSPPPESPRAVPDSAVPPPAETAVKTADSEARSGFARGAQESAADPAAGEPSDGSLEKISGEVQLERRFRAVVEAATDALQLQPDEVDRLVADFMEFQEVNAEVVARHLEETSYDPTSVTVHVPAFPSEGKALRDLFYRRLKTDFTEDQAARIDSELGHFMEAAFRGFGIADQTYTITKSTESPGAFEVRTEVVVPDGVITTSPNPEVAFGGVSETMLVTREQLTTGEFRFLGSVMEKRFPSQ
jgi:hypothetical protein